jgi:hypothetical protein
VDAAAGSPAFAAAARKEIEAAVGPLTPLDPAGLLATGSFEGGRDLTRGLQLKLRARKALRESQTAGVATPPAALPLEAALVGKRPAVLFSRFDLAGAMAGIENYQSLAWKTSSARRIVGNLAALLTVE